MSRKSECSKKPHLAELTCPSSKSTRHRGPSWKTDGYLAESACVAVSDGRELRRAFDLRTTCRQRHTIFRI